MNRRYFLTGAAAASFTGAACRRQTASSYRMLSDPEAAALTALCDQIVPPDQDPGAGWAGAPHYIDIQLTRRYKVHRERYRAGLARADAIANQKFGRALASLTPDGQLQCAQELEKAEPEFFSLLVAHTMQAYYGSPRHGGNREYASWRMLGVTPLPARGRNQYDLTRTRT